MQYLQNERMTPNSRVLLIAAIILVSFNLRPAITSVGPLLGTIRDQIGLTNWGAGTITSLPLLAFAVMSPLAPRLGKRVGNVRAIFLGLVLLLGGIGVRSIPFTVTLFTGTAVIGVGIAIINVLLPAVIKEKFPDRIGRMTSIYSTTMVVFAALASGFSVPLTRTFGLGWELALLSWGALVIVGIVVWLFVMKRDKVDKAEVKVAETPGVGENLWNSFLAWQVTLFMGLQSLLYYVCVSWLPEMLQEFGFSVFMAGWLLSFAQFIGLPSTFFAPILAEKFKHQQAIVFIIGGFCMTGFTGLLIGGPLPLLVVWVTFIGIGLGASISLALALLGLRTRNAQQAGNLSGMAQSFGYILAAAGPLFIGLMYDISNSWNIPLIAIILLSVLMTIAGLGAGRDKYVTEE